MYTAQWRSRQRMREGLDPIFVFTASGGIYQHGNTGENFGAIPWRPDSHTAAAALYCMYNDEAIKAALHEPTRVGRPYVTSEKAATSVCHSPTKCTDFNVRAYRSISKIFRGRFPTLELSKGYSISYSRPCLSALSDSGGIGLGL